MTVAAIIIIGVGRGPSIEGLFCCAVHLCRTLGDREIEKISKKKKENKEKRKEKKKKEKKEERIKKIAKI